MDNYYYIEFRTGTGSWLPLVNEHGIIVYFPKNALAQKQIEVMKNRKDYPSERSDYKIQII